MLFRSIKTFVVLFALCVVAAQPGALYAQPASTICPAGWGHGSLADPQIRKDPAGWGHGNRLDPEAPVCYGGRADLKTFQVEEGNQGIEMIGILDYEAPMNCLSDDAHYTVQVKAVESGESQALTVVGHSGHVPILLNSKTPALGKQMLYVRISSGYCHAETWGEFEIVVVDELF